MEHQEIIDWLLGGDVSIQYQVYRDLLNIDREDIQDRIEHEGWGAAFLSRRNSYGHWGKRYYEPKWISSHYTLLDLRNLGISPNCVPVKESIDMILANEKGTDGGIGSFGKFKKSDVCLNGMFLKIACYFKRDEIKLRSLVDYVLSQRMPDGGFNCRSDQTGARHSSLHSTLSIMEGIHEYSKRGYAYRLDEFRDAYKTSLEFMLIHQLFLSDRTGKVIRPDFLRLSYPNRWRYDILSALDHVQFAGIDWDKRMQPAIDVLMKKRNKHKTWNMQARIPGQVHFDMEMPGQPSRWNTLRVLRVLKHFGIKP